MDVVIVAKKLYLMEQRLNDKCEELDTRLKSLESSHMTLQLGSGSCAAADQCTIDKFEKIETACSAEGKPFDIPAVF